MLGDYMYKEILDKKIFNGVNVFTPRPVTNPAAAVNIGHSDLPRKLFQKVLTSLLGNDML